MWLKYFAVALIAFVGSISCLPEGRILNGTPAGNTTYPFMVSLRRPSGVHGCGASIIAPRWLLTAAHCVMGQNASELSVQYGTTAISVNGTNVASIKRIIMHENFNLLKLLANDIALLELHSQLIYNYKTIAPVTLPEPNFEVPQTQAGAPGVLIGWGINQTFGEIQTHLQEADLKIYSDKECNARYYGLTTTNQICGGVDEGGKGQCNYDSGSPLLYKGSVQLGIVTFSMKPCSPPYFRGVYTKVSHYVDWIHKQIYNQCS